MKIRDLNGVTIQVGDLEEAIKITDEYRQYEHLDGAFSELDRKLNRYWTDLHDKLLKLSSKIHNKHNQNL